MDKCEWVSVVEAFGSMLIGRNNLSEYYDGGFQNSLLPYSPKKKTLLGGSLTAKETGLAIGRLVQTQRDLDHTCITTHAQLELDAGDVNARETILPQLIEEKKVFVRGVVSIDDVTWTGDNKEGRSEGVEVLFNIGIRAIEAFQASPAILILFPNVRIPDRRVFGGFCGSPWGSKNERTLKLHFRKLNPHFQIELHGYGSHVGVLFTYTNPW